MFIVVTNTQNGQKVLVPTDTVTSIASYIDKKYESDSNTNSVIFTKTPSKKLGEMYNFYVAESVEEIYSQLDDMGIAPRNVKFND